jgi:hypothetical protein
VKRATISAALLATYGGAVVWLTWPLAAMATTAIAGLGVTSVDAMYSMWAMAWTSHALVTAPADLPNANIYHPTPHAFFYGPGAFGGVPLFAPVWWLTGNPVLACNVVFMGGVALTAWTLHLVVHRWTASQLAGFVAAATILTNSWLVHGFVAKTPHFAALQYLPLIVYAAARPAGRVREMMPLLGLILAQSLTDGVYLPPAVFIPLAVLALLRCGRGRTRAAGLRLLAVLALAGIALAPLYAGYAKVRRDNPYLHRQSVYPTRPFWHVLPDQFVTPGRGPAVFLPPTIVLVAAGSIALAFRRRGSGPVPARAGWAHGALWTIVGMLISLAPVTWWRGWRVPLPQALIVPVYTHLRSPDRLGIAALIGGAILAGMAFAELARRIDVRGRRRPLAVLLRLGLAIAAIVPLHVGYGTLWPALPRFAAYGLTPPAETLLAALRREPGPVVQVPVNFGVDHTLAMYHSLFHWRSLVNGFASYFPADFPARMALIRELPAPDALAALRAHTGVALVWVRIPSLRYLPQDAEWIQIAGTGRADLDLVARTPTDLLFRIRGPDPVEAHAAAPP